MKKKLLGVQLTSRTFAQRKPVTNSLQGNEANTEFALWQSRREVGTPLNLLWGCTTDSLRLWTDKKRRICNSYKNRNPFPMTGSVIQQGGKGKFCT